MTRGCRRLTTGRASFAVVLLLCTAAALIVALAAGCEDEPSSDPGGSTVSPSPATSPAMPIAVTTSPTPGTVSPEALEVPPLRAKGDAFFGTARYVGSADEGDETVVDDVLQVRGAVDTYRVKVSDPRASGTLTVTVNQDQRGDGSADMWGSWVLESADGSWVCERWTGSVWKGGLGVFTYGVGEGRGAYAGLRSDSCWHIDLEAGNTTDTRIFGVIQKAK